MKKECDVDFYKKKVYCGFNVLIVIFLVTKCPRRSTNLERQNKKDNHPKQTRDPQPKKGGRKNINSEGPLRRHLQG